MKPRRLVLGFHAFTHGFGWILLESSSAPLDWGVVEKDTDRNAQCLLALKRILARCTPDVLAIESFEGAGTARATRIVELCRNVVSLVGTQGIEVEAYTRAEIRSAFPGASGRQEIAMAVAERLPAIELRLPKKRALWESEKPNMALFNAAAVALTHYVKSG